MSEDGTTVTISWAGCLVVGLLLALFIFLFSHGPQLADIILKALSGGC